jgi:hypothetical protein
MPSKIEEGHLLTRRSMGRAFVVSIGPLLMNSLRERRQFDDFWWCHAAPSQEEEAQATPDPVTELLHPILKLH